MATKQNNETSAPEVIAEVKTEVSAVDAILAGLSDAPISDIDGISSSKRRFTIEEDLTIFACKKAGIKDAKLILARLGREGKGHVVGYRWHMHIKPALAAAKKTGDAKTVREAFEKHIDYKSQI